MSLEVIYVTRHGFRSNWLVDPASGEYQAYLKSPTGIAADPALTAHGVDQAKELGRHLMNIQPPVERIYSSPYYRCLQTLQPFIDLLDKPGANADANANANAAPIIRGESGLSEWYGSAPFEHPTSAPPDQLKTMFPALDTGYVPAVAPTRMGETVAQLHDRVATTMDAIIKECDRLGVRAVLICSHAATIIAAGRVLTGNMPDNVDCEDFRAFTCGLSVYKRRPDKITKHARTITGESATAPSPGILDDEGASSTDPSPPNIPEWKGGKGVGGGWICEVNSDCSFLSGGEERGWRFSGDESFSSNQPTAAQTDAGELGVVVQGKRKHERL